VTIQFEADVFPLELSEVNERRRKLCLPLIEDALKRTSTADESAGGSSRLSSVLPEPEKQEKPPALRPTTRYGLVGLALSGGGIRSASFCLGVLQLLAKHGILSRVDFLSTVSGGGYIGSCLSAATTEPQTAGTLPEGFPFRHEDGVPEPKAFKHLRHHASYLAARGLLEWLRIPALLLRGIITNLVAALPWITALALLTYLLVGRFLPELASGPTWLDESAHPSPEGIDWAAAVGEAPWHLLSGAGWVALAWVGYIALSLLAMFGPWYERWRWRNGFQKSFGVGLAAVAVALAVLLQPAVLDLYARALRTGAFTDAGTWWTLAGALVPFLFSSRAANASSRWTGKLGLAAFAILGPAILWLIYLRLSVWLLYGAHDWAQLFHLAPNPWWVAGGAALLGLYTVVFTDVNRTSLHNFYRDRLSKAFIWRIPAEGEEPEHADDLVLSRLNPEGSTGPYHLINAALNLQASRDLDLRDRRSDFFLFSKHFVGCPREEVGYCPTRDLERADRHLNLATAMAISDAAVAPNMGALTLRPLAFVMALLNVRLGYWLPHPRSICERSSGIRWKRVKSSLRQWLGLNSVGPIYLLWEMLGMLSEKRSKLNVSDGGHLENLGIYELLRRRCRYIIACDAETDRDLAFGSLAQLMRYARTDLATEIEIDLDAIRPDGEGHSRRQCAIGEIRYPRGEVGQLLYIKAAVRGDEVEYIREYRKNHPDFPHESTLDQLFSEAQFEAYRALGYHAKRDLFPEPRAGEADWEDTGAPIEVADWFEDLAISLRTSPATDDTRRSLDRQLVRIEHALAAPELWPYRQEIYPELPADPARPAKPAESPEREEERANLFRCAFHVCQLQLRVMEQAHRVLGLESDLARAHPANRGYMNLFRRWSCAPTFRRAWAMTIGGYGAAFQRFGQYALNLESRLVWNPHPDDAAMTTLEKRELAREPVRPQLDEPTVVLANRKVDRRQIWLAEMETHLDRDLAPERFPVGLVVFYLRRDEERKPVAAIRFIRVRNEYRRMGLFPKMIQTLSKALAGEFPGVRAEMDPPDALRRDVLRYADLFEQAGIAIPRRKEKDAPT